MANLNELKICFIAGTLGQGGSERQLYYILKTLKNCGTNLRLFCLTKGEYWEEHIRRLGIPIIFVGAHRSRILRLIKIVSELKKDPPHIIQSHHFYVNVYAAIAARLLCARGIGAVRSNIANARHVTGPFLFRLGIYMPRIISVNSQAAIQDAVKIGLSPKRLFFLQNAIDCNQFKPAVENKSGIIKILIVGRLIEEKRVDVFLSIVERLNGYLPNRIKAMIVGDGYLKPWLEKKAVELGLLPGIIEFRGQIDNVVLAYQESDIFVSTSDYEGSPNVILEAMACGLPVVAMNAGDISRIVRHKETGYVIELGDEQGAVKFILELIKNAELRKEMGLKGRKYIVENYSIEHLPIIMKNLYKEVLR